LPGMFRSKTSFDRFQEQSSATRPSRWTKSRSSFERVRLLVGFKTMAEEGTRLMLERLRTSRNFLSLAEVHFLRSSCRKSYTISFGTEDSPVIRATPGSVDFSSKMPSLGEQSLARYGHALVGPFFLKKKLLQVR